VSAACPVCLSRLPRRTSAQLGEYDVLHCASCRSDSVEPLPSVAALSQAYQDFDAGRIARDSFATFSSQARGILAADLATANIEVNRGDRFLDYGCGGGHFVQAAADLGFAAHGLDLDEASSRVGQGRGLRIESGTAADIERVFGATPFRVMLLMHVLEHVPQPRELLDRLASYLAPGGCLIIGVPDQDSFPSHLKIFIRKLGLKRSELGFVQPPIHLHGFRLETFRALAAGLGLELVAARKTGPLDSEAFPSSPLYWKGLAVQRAVYNVGRLLGSGGHLKAILRRPA
jgi:SAM-dependent methyltransferase